MSFNRYGVEVHQPPNFNKGDATLGLLVPKPTEAWACGFIEKNFEKFFPSDVAGKGAFAVRRYFI
jgi:hypothetical protein